MKTLKHLALCLAAAFIATGCSNDENEPKNGAMKEGKPVKFEMSISNTNTRTSTDAESRMTSWAKGDAVGIFVYDESGEAVYKNVKYEYNGDDWQATGTSGGIMIEDGVTYKYYAYYPYNAESNSAASISLSAITEQNEGNNYDLSDILAARNTDEKTDTENGIVTLLFKHMFAMVEVSLYGDKVANQPTSVKLLNVQQEATINLVGSTDITVTPSGEATNIEMKYLGTKKNAHAYRAVVPAQTINASTPLVAVYGATDGKDYQFSYSVPVPYEQGRYRIMEVKIGEAGSGITIPEKNMNIDPWTPASSVDGDGSYEEILLVTPPTELQEIDVLNESTTITGWFKKTHKDFPTSPISIVEDNNTIWGKSIKLEGNIANAFYKAPVGYIIKDIDTQSTKYYKMTVKVKPTNNTKTLTFTVRNNKNDASFICANTEESFKTFTTPGDESQSVPSAQNLNLSKQNNNEWKEYNLYIDLSQMYKGNPSSNPHSSYIANNIFDKIAIMIYTTQAGDFSTEISDLIFEPYTIPTE